MCKKTEQGTAAQSEASRELMPTRDEETDGQTGGQTQGQTESIAESTNACAQPATLNHNRYEESFREKDEHKDVIQMRWSHYEQVQLLSASALHT